MPIAQLAPEFQQWLADHCSNVEIDFIVDFMRDLNRDGLSLRDPDLIKLGQGQDCKSRLGVTVDLFILPLRISSGWRRGRTVWLGIIQAASGPFFVVGRLDIVRAWAADPSLELVAAEGDLLLAAGVIYP